MAAHRWWRLRITATGSGNAGFAEIELRESPGGADRTGSGTASASGAFGGWPASNAVDNNNGTGWTTYTTGSAPWWWAYDFGSGSAYDIVELWILPRQDGFHNEAPTAFEWQYSDDGSAWTAVRSHTASWPTNAAQTFNVSALPGSGVLVTQEVAEVVLGAAAANVRITQEAAEVVLLPGGVLVTQEAAEVVLLPAAPNVRVTQEVIETVVSPVAANVRVTQEVVEVVLPAGVLPEEPNGWIVQPSPRVYWDGVAEDVMHPRGEFRVNCHPRITWNETVVDTTNRWIVTCKPTVTYVTGPGTASTECISAPGTIPPPAEEPPESLELNYVF